MIYLIKKIWIDSLENRLNSAVGYSIIGYFDNKEEAARFCAKSKIYTQKDCWAIFSPMKEYIYEEINKLNINEETT